jgi:hypothetical protein
MDRPKLGKNRLHIDVNARGDSRVPIQARKEQVNMEIDRLLGLGATKQREVEEMGEYCVVMLNPEGNESCVQWPEQSSLHVETSPPLGSGIDFREKTSGKVILPQPGIGCQREGFWGPCY